MSLINKKLVSTTILAAATIAIVPLASAKDFPVEGPSCAKSHGSIYVDKGANADVWRAGKVADPAGFVEAMVVQSGCFTVTSSQRSAKYILTAGLLTKDQYEQGKWAFQSGDIPGSTPGTALGAVKGVNKTLGKINKTLYGVNRAGRGNSRGFGDIAEGLSGLFASRSMRYGYLQINRNKDGELVGRGFARNNRSTLSYAGWSRPTNSQKMAVQNFNSDKNAKVIDGTLVNAYYDLHKEIPTMFSGGSTANGAMTVSQLEKARRRNANIFRRDYYGRTFTISGKTLTVAKSFPDHVGFRLIDRSDNGHARALMSGVLCGLEGSDIKRHQYMDPGTPLVVRGTLKFWGIRDGGLVLENCKVISQN